MPKVERKDEVSDCSAGVGLRGYVAVMEWRSVQEERPRASTSGGQSAGREVVVDAGATAAAVVGFFLPAKAKREATSLQVRQLARCEKGFGA